MHGVAGREGTGCVLRFGLGLGIVFRFAGGQRQGKQQHEQSFHVAIVEMENVIIA